MGRWRDRDERGTSSAQRLTGIVLAALGLPAAAPAARAEALTMVPPAGVQVEDTPFAIQFTGDASGLADGDGSLDAKIRRGTQAPCASHESADSGDAIVTTPLLVEGAFVATGTCVADVPGDHTICAWLSHGLDDQAVPVSATMTVRAAVLRLLPPRPSPYSPAAPSA